MATCSDCGLEMTLARGCTEKYLLDSDTEDYFYERKVWGAELHQMKHMHPTEAAKRCHDCGVLPGHYHHLGCDAEECPICGGQLISCGHIVFSRFALMPNELEGIVNGRNPR